MLNIKWLNEGPFVSIFNLVLRAKELQEVGIYAIQKIRKLVDCALVV